MKKLLFLLPILASCSVATVSEDNNASEEKIISGQKEALFAGVVGLGGSTYITCTGTLIAPNVVITAAHCIQSTMSNFVAYPIGQAQVGGVYGANTNQSARIIDYVIHQNWKGYVGEDQSHDLAMLYLSNPLRGVEVYEIAYGQGTDYIGQNAKAIGYGKTDANNDNTTGIKMSTMLSIESNNQGVFKSVASSSNESICQGDSGGPLMIADQTSYKLLGVASFVYGRCNSSSWHVDVTRHVDWIMSNINRPTQGVKSITANSFTCSDLAEACSQCYGNASCVEGCKSLAAPQALSVYQPLEECAIANQCTNSYCMQNNCSNAWSECEARSIGGNGGNSSAIPNQEDPTQDPNNQDPNQDPNNQDPNNQDECEVNGWYTDGVCDDFCPQPDPECSNTSDPSVDPSVDQCADNGFYGDGVCDEGCAQPDPDCDAMSGSNMADECEVNGWYSDGVCDDFCPQPDPECTP